MRLAVTHYDLLGVSLTASADEIRDAEAAVRRFYQPRAQRNDGPRGSSAIDAEAVEVLRRLDEARRVLLDEHQRAAYDRDPAMLAHAYIDVAQSPPLGRFAKLAQLDEWLREGASHLKLEDWAAPDPLLDEDRR